MSNQSSVVTLSPKAPAPAKGPSSGAYVSKEEKQRRLAWVTAKLSEGWTRPTVVESARGVFGVGRRAAQKYVRAAEKRMQRGGERENPLFYLQLSKLQRNQLLECLAYHAQQPDKVDPKVLVEVVKTFLKVLESRDRTAAALFEIRGSAGVGAPSGPPLQVQRIDDQTEMLREEEQPLSLAPAPSPTREPSTSESPGADATRLAMSPTESVENVAPEEPALAPTPAPQPRVEVAPLNDFFLTPSSHPLATPTAELSAVGDEDESFQLPPEIMTRLFQKVQEGYSEEEAVAIVFNESQEENEAIFKQLAAKDADANRRKKRVKSERSSLPAEAVE